MYSIDKEKQNDQITVDVHPVSKWKRTLLFLGDFFVSFMVSVLLMNVLVVPVGANIWKIDTESSKAAEGVCNDVLYDNNLLFYQEESYADYKKYDLDANLKYTFNRWLSYYCFESGEIINSQMPEYSKLETNEIVRHYYVDIRNDKATYIDLISKQNEMYDYFDIIDGNITLKNEIRNEVKIFAHPVDKLGSIGSEYYNYLSDIFSALFGVVIQDIQKVDLQDSHGNSFIENDMKIREISGQFYLELFIFSFISFILGSALVYVIYPLINKSNHTPTMGIMKIERIGNNNLTRISKGETSLIGLISMPFSIAYAMFLPLSYTTFIYTLNIPMLPILFIFGIILVIISLITLLISSFNTTLVDKITKTVMIPEEDFDGVIKAKETLKELNKSTKGQ